MKASSKASIKKSERRNLPEDGAGWPIRMKRIRGVPLSADGAEGRDLLPFI